MNEINYTTNTTTTSSPTSLDWAGWYNTSTTTPSEIQTTLTAPAGPPPVYYYDWEEIIKFTRLEFIDYEDDVQ